MTEQTNPTAEDAEVTTTPAEDATGTEVTTSETDETAQPSESTEAQSVENQATESTNSEVATTTDSTEEPATEPQPEAQSAPSQPAEAPKRESSPPPARNQNEDNDAPAEGGDRGYQIPGEYVPSGPGRPRRIGSDVKLSDIDYKNVAVLSRFLDSRGRILSRRKTRVSAKVQRRIVVAIKRARHLALIPYTADQTRIVRKRR